MLKINWSLCRWVGVSIGLIGFVVGGPMQNKVIGIPVFIMGFYLIVLSMVFEAFSEKFSSFGKWPKIGQKVGAIGFSIATLSFLAEYFFQAANFYKALFWTGMLMLIVGVAIGIIKRNSP
jgi:hypothetical protein